jgi:hypothetical protein
MNAQETNFYNSVTGFSPAGIKKALKKEETATTKFWTIKAELGKELAKARDYYNSEEGKAEMDDAGICYNDICDFFQVLTAGQMKKPSVYKRIKVYENISDNNDAPKLFVKAVKEAKEENPNVKIVQSDEGFNYFCANGELKIKGATATANESESESGDAEEGETEESESGDGTQFSFSCKNSETLAGGCIRMDRDYGIIAEDGNADAIKVAMVSYLLLQGYNVVPRS